MAIQISEYKLKDVWTPIRKQVVNEIVTSYNVASDLVLETESATKIEQFLYDYCHSLLNCTMLFSNEARLSELQALLLGVIKHKAYMLVAEWKSINTMLDVDKGKSVHHDSFYDVADTPRIETKDWNEVDVKIRQLNALYSNTQAVKDFYKEIKQLVLTIY